MSNIVKGVVMNNKYLMLYNEYLLNNMYRLTNSNNRARANYKGGSGACGACCDDCDGSCVSSTSSDTSDTSASRHFGKYKQMNIFSIALALPRPSALAFPRPSALSIPRPSALAFPRPSALSIPRPSASPLCSKLCSDNIHNDCICL